MIGALCRLPPVKSSRQLLFIASIKQASPNMPPSRDCADDSSPPVLIVALFLSSACVDGSRQHWLLVNHRRIRRRQRCKRRREVEEVVQPWVLLWKDQKTAGGMIAIIESRHFFVNLGVIRVELTGSLSRSQQPARRTYGD